MGLLQGFLGAPDTDMNDNKLNQYLTADVDDKQWGLNSTLSWDIGGGSTIRLINAYRDWSNEQLDGDVIFTPTPIVSRHGCSIQRAQNHELQFISPRASGWTAASIWSQASITSLKNTSQGERSI